MISEYRHNLGTEDLDDEIETAGCHNCDNVHPVDDMKVNLVQHKAGFWMVDKYTDCPDCQKESAELVGLNEI